MALGNVFDDSKNLPHYTSRKESGIGKEEPIYGNMYNVVIIPPPLVAASGDLLNAHVTSIGGINVYPETAPVEQTYRGATRSFASGLLEPTTNDLSLNFTENLNEAGQRYVYKILRDWKRLIHNPETGERGLKRDYADAQIILEMHDRAGDIFERITFFDCFITSPLQELELDSTNGEPLPLEGIIFRSDYFRSEYS